MTIKQMLGVRDSDGTLRLSYSMEKMRNNSTSSTCWRRQREDLGKSLKC